MKIGYRKINVFMAAFIILWLNSGNFDYVTEYIPSFVKYVIVLFWFLGSIRIESHFLTIYIKNTMPIFLVIGLVLLSKLIGRDSYFNQYFMVYIYIAIINALFTFYFYFGKRAELKGVLLVFFIDTLIVTIHTFIEVLNNPILVRALSTGAAFREVLLEGNIPKGIGGYTLCYQVAFLIICTAYFYGEYKKNILIKYVLYLGGWALLFEAQITIALLMYVIFVASIEMVQSNSSKYSMIIKILLLMIFIAVMTNLDLILQYLVDIADENLAQRLNELLLIGTSNSSEASDFNARIRLYKISIETFANNPLFGSFGRSGFGGHSTSLDILAAYGFFGVFGIFGIFKPLLICYKKFCRRTNAEKYMLILLIGYGVFSMINVSIGNDISLVLCFVIPLFFEYIIKR